MDSTEINRYPNFLIAVITLLETLMRETQATIDFLEKYSAAPADQFTVNIRRLKESMIQSTNALTQLAEFGTNNQSTKDALTSIIGETRAAIAYMRRPDIDIGATTQALYKAQRANYTTQQKLRNQRTDTYLQNLHPSIIELS